MHLPRLEMSHVLLLALLTGLLALFWWHRAVSCKVSWLPTVVTRKQIGAYPRLLHPDLLLVLLRNRRPDRPLRLCVLGWPIPPLLLRLVLKRARCGPDCTRRNLYGLLLVDPAAGAFLFFSAL